MLAYITRRLLLIPLTLLGIMAVNFLFVQLAPGGPVEQALAELKGGTVDATSRIAGTGGAEVQGGNASHAPRGGDVQSAYRGAQGIPPAFIAELEKQFGFDKPPLERFIQMVKSYLVFDFGNSFYRDQSVINLVISKLPVSISLGLWSTLIIYLISIPLGIRKAVRDGSGFDIVSSWFIIIGYAIPGFLFAILLIVLFAGGSLFSWFPLRGLTSTGWENLSWWGKTLDYLWHIALPTIALSIGGFAGLTMLTKNSFLDEINKQYVVTARSKGLNERQILYRHVFRNATLLIIASFPATLVSILFTGSVLIEVLFSLDGIGLLGFEAVTRRDYPVMFGTLYIFSLIGLVLALISDLIYHLVDPRIDFEKRET